MRNFFLSVLVIIALGITYFRLDRQLFYYGKNDLEIHSLLPMNIKPVYRPEFEGGFAIEDEYDFGIVFKGSVRYTNSKVDLNIKDILNYCFDEDKIVVSVVDENNINKYVEISPNKDPTIMQNMLIYVWSDWEKVELKDYKCVAVSDSDRIEMLHSWIKLIFISFCFLLIYRFLRPFWSRKS